MDYDMCDKDEDVVFEVFCINYLINFVLIIRHLNHPNLPVWMVKMADAILT